ncbi:MAG: RIP metalloprotease RseP [Cyclobacteriaceae bacterium]|nr:RIP metalloprotease RseP [Cyclobacteriaceae bacterium]
MEGFIMTAQLLLSLSILIAVHEWGHFIAARTFNIRVEKFYLFFDFLFPLANVANFSLLKYKKGDTEFGVGWFPLGGYVKIAGMVDESMDKEQMKTPPQPWEFRSKPAWQRLIVMLGGIIVNVIVGIIIFVCLTYFVGDTYIPTKYVNTHGGIEARELGRKIGLQTGDKIVAINGKAFDDFSEVSQPDALLAQDSYYTVDRNGEQLKISIPADFIENFNSKEASLNFIAPRIEPLVEKVEKTFIPYDSAKQEEGDKMETIAGQINLQPGDRIVEINGQPIEFQDQVTKAVKGKKLDSLSIKIKRGEETLAFKKSFKDHYMIGYLPKGIDEKELSVIKYSFGQSLGMGAGRAFGVITTQLKAFKKIFSGQISLKNSLSGPIGIAKAYGGNWDWVRFWSMTGLLSMVLAFMNLLPIPALDGGYVMFLLYEMITGREPSEKFFETSLKIGFALLIVLMVFVFYNDIAKLFH